MTVKAPRRSLLILGGYVAALFIAIGAVWLLNATRDPQISQNSSGMAAFGDSMLFLFVLAVASAPSNAGVLWVLRAYPAFWRVASVAALCIASSAVAAMIVLLPPQSANVSSQSTPAMLSPIRILIAPMLAICDAVAGIIAPNRASRIALLVAAGIELVVFVSIFGMWMLSNR